VSKAEAVEPTRRSTVLDQMQPPLALLEPASDFRHLDLPRVSICLADGSTVERRACLIEVDGVWHLGVIEDESP